MHCMVGVDYETRDDSTQKFSHSPIKSSATSNNLLLLSLLFALRCNSVEQIQVTNFIQALHRWKLQTQATESETEQGMLKNYIG